MPKSHMQPKLKITKFHKDVIKNILDNAFLDDLDERMDLNANKKLRVIDITIRAVRDFAMTNAFRHPRDIKYLIKLNLWSDLTDYVFKIAMHPCPQNRTQGSTYVDGVDDEGCITEDGKRFVIAEPLGFNNGITKEQQGLLSFTNYVTDEEKLEQMDRCHLSSAKAELRGKGKDLRFNGLVAERNNLDSKHAIVLCMIKILNDKSLQIGLFESIKNGVMTNRDLRRGIKGHPYLLDSICEGVSLLHIAVRKQNLSLVQTLLELGAKVNQYSNNKQTPLNLAALHKNQKICDVLLKHGADITLENIYGLNSVQCALDKNGNNNSVHNNLSGRTPEVLAVLLQSPDTTPIELSKFLNDNPALINKLSDIYGEGDISMNIIRKDLIRVLLNKGADTNLLLGEEREPLQFSKRPCYRQTWEVKEDSDKENNLNRDESSVHARLSS